MAGDNVTGLPCVVARLFSHRPDRPPASGVQLVPVASGASTPEIKVPTSRPVAMVNSYILARVFRAWPRCNAFPRKKLLFAG